MVRFQRYFLVMVTAFALSCGGGDSSYLNTGSIQATVTNSKSFNPNISHGRIGRYKMTVTGSDFEMPVVAYFDGASKSGTVDGVPVGRGRTIKVEAINSNNQTVRGGEAYDLQIGKNQVTEADVNMDPVPIFTNVANGNVIPNTRLKMQVYSDPNDPVVIEDNCDGDLSLMLDVSTGDTEIFPNPSTGLAQFRPPLVLAGAHEFTVKSSLTGRSTTVRVRVTDGEKNSPAPLYSGASDAPAYFGMAVAAPIVSKSRAKDE